MHSEAAETLKTLPRQAIMMGVRLNKVPKADVYIEDDEVLEIGTLRLRALYTPGHAPGHLAFYVEDEGLIFSGDTLFAGGIGRTDLPGGDMDLLMQSIFERLLKLPDDTRVLSGHGPETTIAREQMTNPFLVGGSL
jgi:hydroxyacylglutathione hydrolase